MCAAPFLQFIIDEVFGVPGVGTVVAGEGSIIYYAAISAAPCYACSMSIPLEMAVVHTLWQSRPASKCLRYTVALQHHSASGLDSPPNPC